jgi:hypothetical protein
LTVEEFELAVEEAIETRSLKIWEIYDLRLLVRFARKHKVVKRFDEIFLKFAGVPDNGYVLKPPKRMELSEPYIKRKQGKMF